MQPCVICGKNIKKKDSVMTMVYVCSVECKLKRKEQLPKKLTVISVDYWINKGMTQTEAEQTIIAEQRRRSPRCVEHWTSKGYSNENALLQVKKVQQRYGKRNAEKYTKEERQQRTKFSPLYWISRGYSVEESVAIIKKNSDNASIDYYIAKYGKKQGIKKYNDMCAYRKQRYTLDGYIKAHGKEKGKELWSKKFKNRHNSQAARQFFAKLLDKLTDRYKIYTATNEHGEYGVLNSVTNQYYFYDFVILDLKLCIEFNGDYWHCNPAKYNADFVHAQTGLTAAEIWKKDAEKIQTILEQRQIQTMVVWESDDHDLRFNEIIGVIHELETNKN